jgi:hypothetical protein
MGSASPSLGNRTRGRRALRPGVQRRRRSRGVSDVIATIIILGITVTLFASLFAFVDSFPPPPSQSVNTFSTTLGYVTVSGKSYISTISVELTAGPSVAGIGEVYLSSENNPTLPQFSAPITVSYGIHNVSTWVVGQSWEYTFPAASRDPLPDNITISIVSAGLLLYNVVVPGNVLALPPSIASSGATPDPVSVGAAFQIYAVFSGNLAGTKTGTTANAYVNVAGIPGLNSVPEPVKMASTGNGAYVYNVSASLTTTNGTYYAFLNLTNGLGQEVQGAITVTLSSTGGSGGGGSSTLSVAVGISGSPQSVLPQQGTAADALWAAVTYPGSLSNVPVYVNFTVAQTPGGWATNSGPSATILGQTGTVSGPSTITVYSQASSFDSWLLNTSVVITATAKLGDGVGSATGSATFNTQNLAATAVYITSSSSGALPTENSFSHSCTPTGRTITCPYLYTEVWDNYTTALGGPGTIYFSGTEYTNSTAHKFTETVASTAVTAGSDTLLNILGGTTAWSQVNAAGTYSLEIVLTLRANSGTGPIIGYLVDWFSPVTVS